MSGTTPTPYVMSLTAAEVETLLLSVYNKINVEAIRVSLVNASDETIPTTKAVADALAVINGDMSSLGNLAVLNTLDLGSDYASGILSVTKGGTGATTPAGARNALGVLSVAETETLIAEMIPEAQAIDLGSTQATGVLPVTKGGTGGSTPVAARSGLGVLSAEESETLVEDKTRLMLARLAAEAGFNLVDGSCEEGAVLTSVNDVVWYRNNGNYYQPNVYPQTVSAGFVPIGNSNWVSRNNISIFSLFTASGGIRIAFPCKSIKDMISLSSPLNGQRVDVNGFYQDTLKGGGIFSYDSSKPKSSHNGITIISPTVPFDGTPTSTLSFLTGTGESNPTGNGCWVRVLKNTWVETSMAGCVIDDSFDDAPLCQKLHDIGLHVEYTPGYYNFGSSVIPKPGQKIFCRGVGFWNINPSRNVKITNNVVGGKIFDYSSDTSYGQVDAPDISGFYLIADYPIYLNPHSGFIKDGASALFPYLMKPRVNNCVLKARVIGTGFGIAATKCFDGDFSGNEIYNFAYNIFLHGSDINEIYNNRLVGATEYQILEHSAQTFGTQNNIYHNDILSGGPSCVYIKSRSRHVLIHDNYLEQTSSCKGFIDVSSAEAITFGTNVVTPPYFTFVYDNRIDGHALATDFVYRLEPTGISVTLRDQGTTGSYATDAKELAIVGAMSPNLPYLYNQAHAMSYDISGVGFIRFRNFKTAQLNNRVEITPQNLAHATANNFYAGRADLHISSDGQSIVLDSTCPAAYMQLRPDSQSGLNNVNFPSGSTITATIWAKTDSASGDTIVVNRMLNSGGSGTPSNLVLTQQYQKFTYTFSGSSSADLIGLYFVRSTNNAAVYIRKIEFS